MNYDELLRELCFEELDTVHHGTLKRRSVLVQIKNDIAYNQANPDKFAPLSLTTDQMVQLKKFASPLTVPLLFCTAVDLVARIKDKSEQPGGRGNNGNAFCTSAIEFFGLSAEHAAKLWTIRNSLSHQYSGLNYMTINSDSAADIISPGIRSNLVVNTSSMHRKVTAAFKKLYEYLSTESESDQRRTRQFVLIYCYLYYRV